MKLARIRVFLLVLVLVLCAQTAFARYAHGDGSNKKFDLVKYHNVGNIWLRVSNYGFFGSGDDIQPQWPSLEYPGGSAIDYLYQGALWFGAKKVRRNSLGQKLYFLPDPVDEDDVVAEGDYENGWTPFLDLAVDTLVSAGFDGDDDTYEFLPAYNPLETAALGTQYSQYNITDTIMYASIRRQRRGIDDDGDGLIDEDPIGYSFPFRAAYELPSQFISFGDEYLANLQPEDMGIINADFDIWFPLGFVNLSDDSNELYNFSEATDDDNDGLRDEDGYPVSEQDFISYYYDYSPFGTSGDRDWGSRKGGNKHFPLNVRVRQMSYQWSYDYIKNLVYVEFDITNMNELDTLYDCAMGVYMDSDVGPQALGGQERANDDVSSYVKGEGYEFAYTYDADFDGGLTTGYVGSRVCTPDPELLDFACWYWNVGQGPDDTDARDLTHSGSPTANQKYWLLTNRNPDDSQYISLRDFPNSQVNSPDDTRYLFAFYGDMEGMSETPTETSWNLEPGKTMKIVIAIFPGETIPELKQQSKWAKTIYGQAQTLETVVQPDTFVHYIAPEPPAIPKVYALAGDNGNMIDVYWDNRSRMDNIDTKTVDNADIGWQDFNPDLDSYIGNYDPDTFPEEYAPEYVGGSLVVNDNALMNPWTGYRLRHDFQGYTLWGRSASGSQEDWVMVDRWDKKETPIDQQDYVINYGTPEYFNFGGELGIDRGFPGESSATEADTMYYHFDEYFTLVPYEIGDEIYGKPLYDANVLYSDDLQSQANMLSFNDQAKLFMNPELKAMGALGEKIYLALYDDKLIPLNDHGGQSASATPETLEMQRKDRLSRRYFNAQIPNPPKGVEYYIAVTAWDRGIPKNNLQSLESGRDADANMRIFFPGPEATEDMDDIYVVPNPYVGLSSFDGRRENDDKGDKSRRLWFVNLPERCTIKIFTLAGDLVDTIKHDGVHTEDIITISKASYSGVAASGIASWDLLSKNNQIIASGVYLFSVKDKDSGDIKVGKFVIIK
ncbi:MAG: hypothetical protein J7K89_00815 [Candidatus Cloacimonetes bacterium]|nr:hypothetical protein [Candidatus Cloacimonadota bacterium]